MLLNSEMLLDYGLLIQNDKGQSAQVGFDLTVSEISKIVGGSIYSDPKGSLIDNYEYIEPDIYGKDNIFGWNLSTGVYSLTFDQGVDLSNKHLDNKIKQFTGFIRHRSSILRSGSLITSGIFDPGFQCDNIGATLFVFGDKLFIEKGARIAQFYVFENHPTSNLYNGNYQGSKDLK